MQFNRYGSVDNYRILVAIGAKIRNLPCHGKHLDGGKAHKDLLAFVATEERAASIRAATDVAMRQHTRRTGEKGNEDV